MYFTNINDAELTLFHKTVQNNLNIVLPDVLASPMFKVEEIIPNTLYKIYPLFYCEEITSSNPNDQILDNKCIICEKNTVTVLSFYTPHVNDATIDLGYSVNWNKCGICVFCYDKTTGNPVKNVEVTGITSRRENFNGMTGDDGMYYTLFRYVPNYFSKLELKHGDLVLDIRNLNY